MGSQLEREQMICNRCLSEDLILALGGYLVVGVGPEGEIALIHHPKPQTPFFEDHDFPELPAPGYVTFEHTICVECGHMTSGVSDTQLELLDSLRQFVKEINEIERRRYGPPPVEEKDAEDLPSSGGSEPGD